MHVRYMYAPKASLLEHGVGTQSAFHLMHLPLLPLLTRVSHKVAQITGKLENVGAVVLLNVSHHAHIALRE